MVADKITSFEDLIVWQKSQDFAVSIYMATKLFPKDEIFAIVSQLRRAAYSISANIAEGFGRSTSNDKYHFYTMAYGSLLEVKNFLYLSQKLGYIDNETLNELLNQSVECQKLLNSFKSKLKT